MQKGKKVEILAPAGSMDALRAAVHAGADAVYMGGAKFGARAFADNPDTDGMLSAIDYTHLYGRRLYLTVNTLLKPEEMGNALYHYLKPYYQAGLDAVIVQDMGVVEFVSREFPGLSIHLSTQMSVVMAEGTRNFRDYPVTRLVPARELGFSELRRMRTGTNLEIETFVHGALCYCYSGQCLMSSMIGGRSGNRGRCAQPCRMEYQIGSSDNNTEKEPDNIKSLKQTGRKNLEGNYLLSPKDICTLSMIPELVEAGIDSFKIEGRMKKYQYAAGVVAAYRTEVDRYFELGQKQYAAFHREHPEVLQQAVSDLQDLYNRGGFSDGYYKMHNGRAMMSMMRPNHSGVKVGSVVQVKKNRAVLNVTRQLNAQDLLELRSRSGDTYEFTLKEGKQEGTQFETNFLPGFQIDPGDNVYRIRNNVLLTGLSEQYFTHGPKIGIDGELVAKAGQKLRLKVVIPKGFRGMPKLPNDQEKFGLAGSKTKVLEENHRGIMPDGLNVGAEEVIVFVEGEMVQRAQKQPITEEKLQEQLKKTGDTPFFFQHLKIYCEGEIFIPVSKLNELRREAMDKLFTAACEKHQRKFQEHEKTYFILENYEAEKDKPSIKDEICTQENSKTGETKNVFEKISASVLTLEQAKAAIASERITRLYYDIAAMPQEDLQKTAELAVKSGVEFFVRLPQICRANTYDWLVQQKEQLLLPNISGYLLRNYEELYLFANQWKSECAEKKLVADVMFYTMNQEAKKFLKKAGVSSFTAPYELSASELAKLGLSDMELIVYGRIPLMVSAQCVRNNTVGCMKKQQNPENKIFLIDRKKEKLPVLSCCQFCYSTIYSEKYLSLLEQKEEIRRLAPAFLRYDFTTETKEEVTSVLLQKTKETQQKKATTSGHFLSGVQ